MNRRIFSLVLVFVCALSRSHGYGVKGYNNGEGSSWSSSYSSSAASASSSSFSSSYSSGPIPLDKLPVASSSAFASANANAGESGATANAGAIAGSGAGTYGTSSTIGGSGLPAGSGVHAGSGAVSDSKTGSETYGAIGITGGAESPVGSGAYTGGSPGSGSGSGAHAISGSNAISNANSQSGHYSGATGNKDNGQEGLIVNNVIPGNGGFDKSNTYRPGPVGTVITPIVNVQPSTGNKAPDYPGSYSGSTVNSENYDEQKKTDCCKGPFPGPSGSIHDYKPAPPGGGGPDPAWLTTGGASGSAASSNSAVSGGSSSGYTPGSTVYVHETKPTVVSSSDNTGNSGLSYNLINSLPGAPGNIHTSKPATGYPNIPSDNANTAYPSGHGSVSTISSVVGTLPGSTGNIHESKPVSQSYKPAQHIGSPIITTLPGQPGSIHNNQPSTGYNSGSQHGNAVSSSASSSNLYNQGTINNIPSKPIQDIIPTLPGSPGTIHDSKPSTGYTSGNQFVNNDGSSVTTSGNRNQVVTVTSVPAKPIIEIIPSLPGSSGSIYDSKLPNTGYVSGSQSGSAASSSASSTNIYNQGETENNGPSKPITDIIPTLPGSPGSIHKSKPASAVSNNVNTGSYSDNTYNKQTTGCFGSHCNKPVITEPPLVHAVDYTGCSGPSCSGKPKPDFSGNIPKPACQGSGCVSSNKPYYNSGAGCSGSSCGDQHSGTYKPTVVIVEIPSKPQPSVGCSGGSCGTYNIDIDRKPIPGVPAEEHKPSGCFGSSCGSQYTGSYKPVVVAVETPYKPQPSVGCSGGSCDTYNVGIDRKPIPGIPTVEHKPTYGSSGCFGSSCGSQYTGSYKPVVVAVETPYKPQPSLGCSGGSCGTYDIGIDRKPIPGRPGVEHKQTYGSSGCSGSSCGTQYTGSYKPIVGTVETPYKPNTSFGCTGGSCGTVDIDIRKPIPGVPPVEHKQSYGSSGCFGSSCGIQHIGNYKPVVGTVETPYKPKPSVGCAGGSCGTVNIGKPISGIAIEGSKQPSSGCIGGSCNYDLGSYKPTFGTTEITSELLPPLVGPICGPHDKDKPGCTAFSSGISSTGNTGTIGSFSGNQQAQDKISYSSTNKPVIPSGGIIYNSKPVTTVSESNSFANAQANAQSESGKNTGSYSVTTEPAILFANKVTKPYNIISPGTGNLPIEESGAESYFGQPVSGSQAASPGSSKPVHVVEVPSNAGGASNAFSSSNAASNAFSSSNSVTQNKYEGGSHLGCTGSSCNVPNKYSTTVGGSGLTKPVVTPVVVECSGSSCGGSGTYGTVVSGSVIKPNVGCSGSYCGHKGSSSDKSDQGFATGSISINNKEVGGCSGGSCGSSGSQSGANTGSFSGIYSSPPGSGAGVYQPNQGYATGEILVHKGDGSLSGGNSGSHGISYGGNGDTVLDVSVNKDGGCSGGSCGYYGSNSGVSAVASSGSYSGSYSGSHGSGGTGSFSYGSGFGGNHGLGGGFPGAYNSGVKGGNGAYSSAGSGATNYFTPKSFGYSKSGSFGSAGSYSKSSSYSSSGASSYSGAIASAGASSY